MKIIDLWKKGYSYSHQNLISNVRPQVFNIELSNICGMNCIMCPRKYMTRKLGNMDINLFKKITSQLHQELVSLHHFGDPLLYPKLDGAIKICRQHGIKTNISVNPVYLTEKNIRKISGLDYLHISLDGANAETYEKIRGRQADYNASIKNIQNFLKIRGEKPFTTLAIIKMKETEKQIQEFKNKWNVKGINKIEVKEMITWDGSKSDTDNLASEFTPNYERGYIPCIKPWTKLTVLWDGRATPCCYDYDGKCIVGDLNKQTISEIWNSKEMQELRKQHRDNNFPNKHLCKNCRERQGFSPSKFFPLNLISQRRLKFLTYYKHN